MNITTNTPKKARRIAGPRLSLSDDGYIIMEIDGPFQGAIASTLDDISCLEDMCTRFDKGLVDKKGRALIGDCKELDLLTEHYLRLA